MPTRTRKSPAKQGRKVFAELAAVREQLAQLETLHATLDAVRSRLLALVATYRPSLLKKKGKSIRTLGAGRGGRMRLRGGGSKRRRASPESKQKTAMKVWIYIDASKQIDDPDHLKVFTSQAAADGWFEDHGPEGVVVEY